MSDETFVQVFWFLLFVVVWTGALIATAAGAMWLTRTDYYHYLKLQKAKQRWAEMMSPNQSEESK